VNAFARRGFGRRDTIRLALAEWRERVARRDFEGCGVGERTPLRACDARPVRCLAGDLLRSVASVDAQDHERSARVAKLLNPRVIAAEASVRNY
jgi:hypothetical protein